MAKRKRRNRNGFRSDIFGLTGAGVGIAIGTGTVAGVERAAGVNSGVLPAFRVSGSLLGLSTTAAIGGRILKRTKALRKISDKRRREIFID